MGDTIVDVDDIKDQLSLVVNELRSFAARLDEMKTSQRGLRCGFETFFDLTDRHRDLIEKTKPGKSPSRQTIFLLLCVIDSMKNGPISEKEIKEHIIEKCRIYGMKSTNRGTVAGSNIEVSAACHILAAFGIIESFSENIKEKKIAKTFLSEKAKSSDIDQLDKVLAEKLLNVLSSRWDISVSKQRADSNYSTVDQENKNSIFQNETHENNNDINGSTEFFNSESSFYGNQGRQEFLHLHSCEGKEEFLDDNDMDFVDILLERSDSLIHGAFQNDFAFTCNDSSLIDPRIPKVESDDKLLGANDSFLEPSAACDMQIKDTSIISEPSFDNFPTNEILTVDGMDEDEDESLDDEESEDIECEDHDENNKLPDLSLGSSVQNFGTIATSEELVDAVNNLNRTFSAVGSDTTKNLFSSFSGGKQLTRKSHSTSRVWKLRESFHSHHGEESNELHERVVLNPLWINPGDVLKKWNEVSFDLQSKLETEEKLLRKLFSQCYDCGNSYDTAPKAFGSNRSVQLGTRYLDGQYGDLNRRHDSSYDLDSCNFDTKWNSEHQSSSYTSIASHNTSLNNKRDLLDEKIQLSGLDLIEKVRKSRRQRGNSIANFVPASSTSSSALQSSQLNSSAFYLNNMRSICLKASQSFWQQVDNEAKVEDENGLSDNGDDAPSSSSQHISKLRKTSNLSTATLPPNQISVMELLKQLLGSNNSAVVNNSLVNTIMSNYSQNLAINGVYPNLSISTLRHYAFPISKCSIDFSNGSFACEESFPYLADLIVTTIEIPWKSLISEFSVIKGDDVMRIHSISVSNEQEKEDFEFDGGTITDPNATPQFDRKRSHSRTFSQLEYGSQSSFGYSSDSIRNVMKCQVSSDVVAPSFREIPIELKDFVVHSSENGANTEDTTDEWYLRKHDEVLRNMREKWALMQQLKLHTRRDSFSHNLSSTYQLSGSSSRKSYSTGTLLESTRSPINTSLDSSELILLDESGDNNLSSVNMKRSHSIMVQGTGNVDLVQPVKKRGRPPKLQKMNHMHYGRVTT